MKSVLGEHVQNTIDFITKDIPNYILRVISAATTCHSTIGVGILAFGSILLRLYAPYERSLAAMMKRCDRSIDRKM